MKEGRKERRRKRKRFKEGRRERKDLRKEEKRNKFKGGKEWVVCAREERRREGDRDLRKE